MRMTPNLEVRDVPGKGRGVFATNNISKGDFVCRYRGELLTEEQAEARAYAYDVEAGDKDVAEKGCYMFWFDHDGRTLCIDAAAEDGSFGRLINHSRNEPNVAPRALKLPPRTIKLPRRGSRAFRRPRTINVQPGIGFHALRDIAPGEELLYDYGEDDPEILAKFPWLCV